MNTGRIVSESINSAAIPTRDQVAIVSMGSDARVPWLPLHGDDRLALLHHGGERVMEVVQVSGASNQPLG